MSSVLYLTFRCALQIYYYPKNMLVLYHQDSDSFEPNKLTQKRERETESVQEAQDKLPNTLASGATWFVSCDPLVSSQGPSLSAFGETSSEISQLPSSSKSENGTEQTS